MPQDVMWLAFSDFVLVFGGTLRKVGGTFRVPFGWTGLDD